MCLYEGGDVVRYDHMYGGADKRIEAWVLMLDRDGKGVMLKGSFDEELAMFPGRRVTLGDSNRKQQGRCVVPPEEWPDDISALVAEIKLTGVIGCR